MTKSVPRPHAGRNWFLFALGLFFAALAVGTNLDQISALAGYHYWVGLGILIALEIGALAAAMVAVRGLRRATALTMMALCIATSVGGSLAFRWSAHVDAQASLAKRADAYGSAKNALERVRTSLEGYDSVRPTVAIRTDLNECGKCKSAPRWRSELERAEKRDGLVAAETAAAAKVAETKPSRPLASGIALYLHSLLGLDIERVEMVNTALFVLALQFGAPAFVSMSRIGAGDVLVSAGESKTNIETNAETNIDSVSESNATEPPVAPVNIGDSAESNDQNKDATPSPGDNGGTAVDSMMKQILADVAQHGHTRFTFRDKAEEHHASVSATARAVRRLKAINGIEVESSRRGTLVRQSA